MDIQEYINEECKRIKQDLLKEFDAMLTPMESGLLAIYNEIQLLDSYITKANIQSILLKKNNA